MTLLDTGQIAAQFGLSRPYVCKLTKRAGFPAPVVNLSRKTRKWRADEVARFVRQPKRSDISASETL